MKKYFVAFVSFSMILLLRPALSSAIFLIELKNGRTIRAENYVTEGNNIVLYVKSGEVRISKGEIKSISEKKEDMEEDKNEETADQKRVIPENPDTKESVKNIRPEKNDIESDIKKKAEIQERLEKAKKVYFNAKEKSEKERARETMTSISKELFSLQEEVTKTNNGILPEWWKEN
jgi:hypothetical protein